MKSVKCPNCGSVSSQMQKSCKRCSFSFTSKPSENSYGNGKKIRNLAFSTGNGSVAVVEADEFNIAAWRKIKSGLIISILGFALTSVAIYFEVFRGYENADEAYITLVKIFSLVTILPSLIVLAGVIEVVSGISIFKIIEKWEEMPHWMGLLIAFGASVLILFVILFVAAVVIFNLF